ncbi:MAG TPA: hypothetical protein VJI13_00175 [Candidatus Norongarragalinales archaeon]|nr:hypothetical protein [Candidatus Norongarragalinales archaeon]
MSFRAQFAIEMFFAFTFAVLLVFWLVNYLEVFSRTADQAAMIQSQQLIARNIGKIVNDVCAYGGNASSGIRSFQAEIDAPCLKQKQVNWYYGISADADGRTLLIQSDASNFTAKYKTSCPLATNTNLTSCSLYNKLCIFKSAVAGNQRVTVESGACT